jgi:hypothetical protein
MSSWQQQRPVVPEAGVQIEGVQPDFTKNGKQRFMVQMSNGKAYSTFDPQLASEAQSLIRQGFGTLLKEINGQYENYAGFQLGVGGQTFTPPAQNGGIPAVSAPVFTPAPGFTDAKDIRISRGNAVNAASAALSSLIGTGIWLDGDGELDEAAVADAVISVARGLAAYIIDGPQTEAAPVVQSLPPGATPEQAAAWANAEAGAPVVQVGAPVVPAEAAPAAAAY